ncbi:MAG: type VI secretion system baseplate subunit TssG [Planctomycetaceae bacterium]|nr:type VI secretion system baseplate subunit TssG [Planctomycetaceae bacterium]MCP4478600.1 type VI secretion system baseplate subunit TssG [Planctomycetaceae bacterium]MCP4773972.1 type VI secretion system baseplate subunit TssG [Planctomycetaceae bacterium]
MGNNLNQEIIDQMTAEPFHFDWVQLVRIVYLLQDSKDLKQQFVGFESEPNTEAVRFKSSTRMRHPSSEVVHLQQLANARYAITVSFLGLVGAAGVLPHHYSHQVIARQKQNDSTLINFFDLFHHRTLSYFFRASVKYRLPFQYELSSHLQPKLLSDSSLNHPLSDPISRSLSCLVGLGDLPVRNRHVFDDRAFLYFSGHFSTSRPTASGLKRILSEFIKTTVKINQFQFEWLNLEISDQTKLGDTTKALGLNMVIGSRVGSIQNRFRIRLGPLSWENFSSLLPDQNKLPAVADFIRAYVGTGLDFDIQLLLNGNEIPRLKLGDKSCSQLGRNTWLSSIPLTGEIDDVTLTINNDYNLK